MTDKRAQEAVQQLLDIMGRLRDSEHGCPWDLQQTFSSIAPYTLEETYEVLDAIELGNYTQLASELGDLLFQVVFLGQLGKEQALFDFADIAQQISSKLLRRHPHVFPSGSLDDVNNDVAVDANSVVLQWEAIKAEEREQNQLDKSILADIPGAFSALIRAGKLQKRASRAGMDWVNIAQVRAKVLEELAELEQAHTSGDRAAVEDELGDLLFSVVNLSRYHDVDAETALRKANRKFESRIRKVEKLLLANGRKFEQCSIAELDDFWKQAKQLGSED